MLDAAFCLRLGTKTLWPCDCPSKYYCCCCCRRTDIRNNWVPYSRPSNVGDHYPGFVMGFWLICTPDSALTGLAERCLYPVQLQLQALLLPNSRTAIAMARKSKSTSRAHSPAPLFSFSSFIYILYTVPPTLSGSVLTDGLPRYCVGPNGDEVQVLSGESSGDGHGHEEHGHEEHDHGKNGHEGLNCHFHAGVE